MKTIARTAVIIGTMVIAGTVAADIKDVKFNLGADYLQSWSKGKTGNNPQVVDGTLFAKSYPGATLYLAAKYSEYLGVEFGIDWQATKKKSSSIPRVTDINNFNPIIPPGLINIPGISYFNTEVSRRGVHLDLVGYLPILGNYFDFFGSIGLGLTRAKVSFKENTRYSLNNPGFPDALITRNLKLKTSTTGIIRLGVGVSYMVTEAFGVRAKLGYEGTKIVKIKDVSGGNITKPFKDSTTVAVGVFAKF